MRLGQLARKISVHTSEIVSFLATYDINIEDGTNTRIADDQVNLVYTRFAPHLLATVEAGFTDDNEEVEEPVAEAVNTEVVETTAQDISDSVQGTLVSSEPVENIETTTEAEFPDVIKAPKVELKGLTVLGKIELPSPKKKEPVVEEEGAVATDPQPLPKQETSKPRQERRQPRRDERRSNDRPRKNPVAVQREREAREAEERRREEKIREKEKRTQYYQSRVKPAVPTKAARIVDEPLLKGDEQNLKDKPKTLWGKFVRWLTT